MNVRRLVICGVLLSLSLLLLAGCGGEASAADTGSSAAARPQRPGRWRRLHPWRRLRAVADTQRQMPDGRRRTPGTAAQGAGIPQRRCQAHPAQPAGDPRHQGRHSRRGIGLEDEQDGQRFDLQRVGRRRLCSGLAQEQLGAGRNRQRRHERAQQHFGVRIPQLDQLKRGDTLEVFAGGTEYTYAVDEVLILPEKHASDQQRKANVKYIQETPDDRLTLVSCWPRDDNTHRIVVIARPTGRRQPRRTDSRGGTSLARRRGDRRAGVIAAPCQGQMGDRWPNGGAIPPDPGTPYGFRFQEEGHEQGVLAVVVVIVAGAGPLRQSPAWCRAAGRPCC